MTNNNISGARRFVSEQDDQKKINSSSLGRMRSVSVFPRQCGPVGLKPSTASASFPFLTRFDRRLRIIIANDAQTRLHYF